MLKEVLTVSALIAVVLLVRAIFKNRVPKRMIYCLWLVVLLKLCLPGTLFSLPVLPAEEVAAPVNTIQITQVEEATLPAVSNAPTVQAPSTPGVQSTIPTQTAAQPEQTVKQPQEPVAKPAVPAAQEPERPAAKPLTAAQILKIVWFSGSALLGLWLFGTWLTFTIRLRKSRKFLGRRGKTNIYISKRIKSPCLAGLIPAVYLTEDVLRNDTTELIVRHELTHLHHLDFLWSLCRTIAVIVYWWNPLIWLAAICSKRDAELACDEAVAAGLVPEQRIAYARVILAQAPRKKAALSLAGPPVKERILFLTKKQKTNILCIVLALALTISATGCSFAELTRRKTNAPASSTEEAQPKTEPQAEAAPEPVAEITQPERTSPEEELSVDETARAAWFDFAHQWRLDILPVFSHGAAPTSASAYLYWMYEKGGSAIKEQGYMSKEYVETEIKTHFEVKDVIHTARRSDYTFDGERYTPVPLGPPEELLVRLDSVLDEELGGKTIYYVQYCLMAYDKPLRSQDEWDRYRMEIVNGDTPDLHEVREYTLSFSMQDGEPVFLSHTELSIEEPPFTPLPNDGTYDVTQPLQEWELTRTNGVQTGMTQAQVEAITGSLVPDAYGNALLDNQSVFYYFRQNGYRTPQLMELRWDGTVENDEIVCETAQDAPAFRGICLGDTIDEVFDKFPCVDRELKRWQSQYVYGYEGADDYAVLSLIADSFYMLSFTVNGQRRAEISFSRVQQRVFEIVVYSETYWQDMNQTDNQEDAVDTSFLRDTALREAITSDLSALPDGDFLAFIIGIEAVQPDDTFIFNDPGELSSDELFRMFLWWTDRSVLEEYQNPDDGLFYFPASIIHRTLDCYFRWYTFDIRKCAGYDAESGTVVAQTIYLEGRDQDVLTQMVSKTTDGHEVTYTVDFYPVLDRVGPEPFARKEYTFLCYPGDFYIESARYVSLDGAAAQ